MNLNNKFGWQDIEGWFGFASIYDEMIRLASQNEAIVEVGCWSGKSTCYLASRAKMSGKNIKIIAVDQFKDKDLFLKNMIRAGVIDRINILDMNSEVAAHNIKNEAISSIFIDAENIPKEIKSWYPKIKKRGILAGHDWYGSLKKSNIQTLSDGTWRINKV